MLDVSAWQGHIEWELVAKRHKVAMIKAAEGYYEVDPLFSYNLRMARRFGLVAGAYFYGHPSIDAKAQARHFINVAHAALEKGCALPWLDIEVREGSSLEGLQRWAAEWFSVVDPYIRRKAVLYTYSSFAEQFGRRFVDRPLAIANFDGKRIRNVPRGRWPLKMVYYHQWTNKAMVKGINGRVDLDARYAYLSACKIPGRVSAKFPRMNVNGRMVCLA